MVIMSSMDTVSLAQSLIREPSVTPEDGNCQKILAELLEPMGFEVESLPYGQVKNLWALRTSEPGPILCFAGHTDVVPTGPESDWQFPPFDAVLDGDTLHGRGAADMKGSLAAMLTATGRFLATHEKHQGSIAFLVTSDEEGAAVDGTVKVMEELAGRGTTLDYCVIGEPSSRQQVGDVIRVGRRGSLNGRLTVRGIQGHVAYPDKARNPIHESSQAIAALTETLWDEGNDYFPVTSFQVSGIHAGTGANNVIPQELVTDFNFRFGTASSEESLRSRTESILARHCSEFVLDWTLSGPPFLTEGGRLIPAVQQVIRGRLAQETELSTSGGTSDGRFIAPLGAEVVELGPCNASIHQVNEQVSASSLDVLSLLYEDILVELLT